MIDKNHTQKRIQNLVQVYKKGFPLEYESACKAVELQRKIIKDETGKLEGEHAGPSAQRVLNEIPETLYHMFIKELDGDELAYFKSKEGSRWFTKNNPQFALSKT